MSKNTKNSKNTANTTTPVAKTGNHAAQAKKEKAMAKKQKQTEKANLDATPITPEIAAPDASREDHKQHVLPVRLSPDHSRYHWVQTERKGTVYDNGDPVAVALRDLTLEELFDKVEAKMVEAGRPYTDLRSKYANLNNGMKRMNLGNLLRGLLTPKAVTQPTKAVVVNKEKATTTAAAPKGPIGGTFPMISPPVETLD